jgi:hypothetical protein
LVAGSIPAERANSEAVAAQPDLIYNGLMSPPPEITIREEEQILDSAIITALMAETNASGFAISAYSFNQKDHTYDIVLSGENDPDASYCGDKIKLKAARGSEEMQVLEAEIDKGYDQDM